MGMNFMWVVLDEEELVVIGKALREIESSTCVRFRQYQATDPSFIVVRGHDKGT